MTQPKIFVFRIAKGQDSGKPIGNCPLDYTDILKKIEKISNKEIIPIDYENNGNLEFIKKEFREKHTLRQGWGIKNLDLYQLTKCWIENYMYSGKIFWNINISCSEAKGRWNIMRRMLDMNKGDILLIPKTSQEHLNDYNKFTVCKVKEKYCFDYPETYKDFGHSIKVSDLRDFKYDENNLLRNDFGSPYLWAITEVKKHHKKHQKFTRFLENNYI